MDYRENLPLHFHLATRCYIYRQRKVQKNVVDKEKRMLSTTVLYIRNSNAKIELNLASRC